jgi:hypothetical protein
MKNTEDFSFKQILDRDFSKEDLSETDFSGSLIKGCNFNNAVLKNASFKNSRIVNSSFIEACLEAANLNNTFAVSINFSWAKLSKASMIQSNVSNSNFYYASLRSADLTNANLRRTNLYFAILKEAIVKETLWPSPQMVLLACWGEVSDDLCTHLMRYDADNYSNPNKFVEWANDVVCPYLYEKFQRSANFTACRKLITDNFLDIKPRSAYDLAQELLRECCITYNN